MQAKIEKTCKWNQDQRRDNASTNAALKGFGYS